MLRLLTAIGFAALSGEAFAGVTESRFDVIVTTDGKSQTYDDAMVPLRPGEACYYWNLRYDAATKGPLTLIETLKLPEPLATWKDFVNTPGDATQIGADAMTAVSTLELTPDGDGWVSHGWCVEAGDPLGSHRIEVNQDGEKIADWGFDVVPPEDFNAAHPVSAPSQLPAQPPDLVEPTNTARDVNQSW